MVDGKQKEVKAKLTDIVQPGDTIIVRERILLGLIVHERYRPPYVSGPPLGTAATVARTNTSWTTPRPLQAALDRDSGVPRRLRRRTVNALRETPVYQAHAQLLIEKDTPKVATLDQMFQSQDGWYDDDFYQTQFRILQSRTLAKRTIDAMKLWDAPRLGNGPEPKGRISFIGHACGGVVDGVIALGEAAVRAGEPPPPPRRSRSSTEAIGESAGAVGADRRVPGRLSIVAGPQQPDRRGAVRVDRSGVCGRGRQRGREAYIQQNMEIKFTASKDAADFLSERLAEQRKAVEASEAALQAYKERNGAVSVADSASNIVVQRLTDLNGGADQGQDGAHQQGGALQPAEVGRERRRARYLPGGPVERIHPEAEGRPRRSAAPAGAARGAIRPSAIPR